ncbi:MAG: hypothetical protein A2452_13485 [Candidatus Firestonebacteria bacterium RIFOXYC2_FULL_39_67]|nr:MAG: hypothetical protein A2452_13485 [Candidatus Firestonebacteria bacterium RIFOXYC2_FULL_39_67]OGF57298.1 MAG: hypothetical protein A2497_03715 [Candidatus Firestonebacteria bacterium RifOxyC12_full_39_7]
MKIFLTGSYSLNYLKISLQEEFLSDEIVMDEYDSYIYSLTDEDSKIHTLKPNIIIIYLDSYDNKVNSDLMDIINKAKRIFKNAIFIVTAPVKHLELDSVIYVKSDPFEEKLKVDYVINLNKVISYYGWKNVYNTKSWYSGKILFNLEFYNVIARYFRTIIDNFNGKKKKALIVDLDNTLWSGVAADEGIKISKDGIYSSFWIFQEKLKKLKEKGIVLAICSKNNLNTITNVFRNNTMPLSLNDFVAIKCNWADKVANIKEIASELNLGLDAFAFIDDNRTEIEWVKSQLPEVESHLLPERFTEFPDYLDNIDSLNKFNITNEDLVKTNLYQQATERENHRKKYSDYKKYLRSLKLSYKIKVNDLDNMKRASQLTQKTNQFNLTLKKYTELELIDLINNGGFVYSLELDDIYGKYGIVAAAVVIKNSLEAFVVSCRAFNKNVEDKLFEDIIMKHNNLTVSFVKSKNNLVAESFYKRINK